MANKLVLKRHKFWFTFYRPVANFIAFLFHYKSKTHFEMNKNEQYIVLSNHQTDMDGIFTPISFNRPLYAVVTDSFLSKGWAASMFRHQLGLIPKKKGAIDIKANMDMVRVVKEGGSLLIFPEGNRSYAEFQFPMVDGFGKFVKFFKKTIVLFNIHGGTGTSPRFGNKRRKGPYYGEVKRVIPYEEYKDWSNEEVEKVITENLKVYDSESGLLYKSNTRNEFLERMFFVCPKCGAIQTLTSKGNKTVCDKCGLEVEFTEDLKLKSGDKDFKFNKLVDWYNFQLDYVKNMEITSKKPIFSDKNVKLFISNVGEKRKLINQGDLTLYQDKIVFGKTEISISDIEIASPISGTKFNFSTADKYYLVIGDERFNPLKYILLFNKLDTKMKVNKADIYYSLEGK